MELYPKYIFLAVILFTFSRGFSQTCCTGGAPITGSFKINVTEPKSFHLRFTYDYNKIEDIYSGKDELDNGYLARTTRTFFVQADYALSSKFSMSLLLPYISLKEEVAQLNQSLISQANGLGDLSIVGQFHQPITDNSALVLGAGLKFPAGQTQKVNEQDGFILPANLQPGTGSYDPLFVIHYQAVFGFRRSLLFSQSVYYRLNTPTSKFTFHDRYKFGNEVQIFTGLSDQLLIGNGIHNPSLLLRFRHTKKDEIEDFYNDNTGGSWLYLVPGWNYIIHPNVSLGVSGEIPLYRNLNGLQITTTYKLIFTIGFQFNKNEDS